ncbi:hypothetical protein GGQ99_000860 [Aminobacter niigataensis]|uniref:Uncharacterized protein n=1 Tax=Aminobacter niigataensis TaxID=83265 RepID=A0ABR6KXI3_9HYPH|nr:hypothetical protein [Aminobacter niigataensis]MBB4649138.1 hypothetical protein [Aminobacter niigataensis]
MKFLALAAAAAFLSACYAYPDIEPGYAPADADAPLGSARYMSVFAGSANYVPVKPRPWAEINERVAPKPEVQ